MSEKIKVPKYYEWVFWHYDDKVHTQYMPEHPDMTIFERQITEIKAYHEETSKVKRAAWLSISNQKATFVNIKARYMEALAGKVPALIYECHGEFPFITRRLDIRYLGKRAGEHEYYYVMGIGGELVPPNKLEGIPKHYINGRFSIIDRNGNTRHDHTSELVPAIPPEAADNMPQIVEEIAKYTTEV